MASKSTQPLVRSECRRGNLNSSGFGLFKIALTAVLTVKIIVELATLFGYPPALIDELRNAKDCALLMVSSMEERGQISPVDISPLVNTLLARQLYGVAKQVEGWFHEYLSTDAGNQPQTFGSEQRLPTELEEKKKLLIGQLKGTYEVLYDKVQPIPYIKEKLYTVNKIFVEVGIESKQHESWRKFCSHHDILSVAIGNSRIQIIEGDPGYGKSTLALQLVYDWCNNVPESEMKHIDIVIFLNLRQLGGVKSIYKAIAQFLLTRDSTLKEDDVRDLLESKHLTKLILFDAYDEYPDQEDSETDVALIIREKMFREVYVILTTRSSYIPRECTPRAGRIRLTGFNYDARIQYIRRAIKDDMEIVEAIMGQFKANPVLGDICEAPLFFVMYAHLTQEEEGFQHFDSVTHFFEGMIICFHKHMRNKLGDKERKKLKVHERDHRTLDRLAFKALTGKHQHVVWRKEYIRKDVGKECYDLYTKIGILAEEEVLDENRDEVIEVRFYHKLFCEWYAAHHLVKQVKSLLGFFIDFSRNIDPFDLQFVYRFACGLDKTAASKVLKLLGKKSDGAKFAILCSLEQHELNESDVTEIVRDIVSQTVHISVYDSRLLQRTTIQLMELAAQRQAALYHLTMPINP